MEKEILDALKTRFKNLGFGDKAFEGVAKFLATTVTEKDQIETAITGVEPLLKSFQGDADSRVNSAVAKAKAESGKSKPTEKKEDDPNPEDKDVPAWAQTLIEQNKKQAERLEALESGKTADSRKIQLESKLKDAPEKIKASFLKQFERMSFKDDEDFTGFLSDVETEVKEFAQDFSNSGLKGFGPPKVGGGKDTKEASKEEVKSVVDEIMPK